MADTSQTNIVTKQINATNMDEPTIRLDIANAKMVQFGARTFHGASKWEESHPEDALTFQYSQPAPNLRQSLRSGRKRIIYTKI